LAPSITQLNLSGNPICARLPALKPRTPKKPREFLGNKKKVPSIGKMQGTPDRKQVCLVNDEFQFFLIGWAAL